uniref:Uncharacterized protein n=1 Tax=Panagrolaimus sp. JU765 TaxID=591449 RepID=A0AC34QLV1_9BILA
MAPIPSTSASNEDSSTSASNGRRFKTRPTPVNIQIYSDLLSISNETLPQPPHLRRNQLDERARTTYGAGPFSRSGQQSQANSIGGIFVLVFVMMGIVIVLLLFYFLAKVCNTPESTSKRAVTSKNGTVIIRTEVKQNVEIIPSKVPLPKRIYELKAEEGYYSCPPSIDHSLADIFGDSSDEKFFVNEKPQRSQSASEAKELPKKQPIETCVRKLTGAGMPANFKPKGRLQELIQKS